MSIKQLYITVQVMQDKGTKDINGCFILRVFEAHPWKERLQFSEKCIEIFTATFSKKFVGNDELYRLRFAVRYLFLPRMWIYVKHEQTWKIKQALDLILTFLGVKLAFLLKIEFCRPREQELLIQKCTMKCIKS